MKKATVVVITIAMLASFAVVGMAQDSSAPVVPGKGIGTAISALEYAQVEVSKDLPEQALLLNDFANKRMEALGQAADNAEGFGADVIELLMDDLAGYEGNLGLIIAELASGKDVPVDAAVQEEIADDISKRGERLADIIADETMPAGAKAGAQKALDNMEAAAQRADAVTPPEAPEDLPPVDAPPEGVPPVNVPEDVPADRIPAEKP